MFRNSRQAVAPPGAFRVRATITASFVSGLLALCIYFYTLAPTVTGEDSGELITAAYYFGVPHPPGYPLWTLLCGAWLHLIPFGDVAWRANLFSAVCTAVAVALQCHLLCAMRMRPLIAATAALAGGLGAATWSQSVITEVYTLNLACMAGLCWLVWRWGETRDPRWLVGGSLLFGLGMCNHHILGFAALGLLLWALATDSSLVQRGQLAASCIACAALGLVPYVYLLWAGRRDVPVNWGEINSLAGMWEHVSRGQYFSDHPIEAPLVRTAALQGARLYYGLRWLTTEFTVALVPCIGAGFWRLWRDQRPLAIWTLALGTCCGPLYLLWSGPVMDRQDEFVQKVFLTPLSLIATVPLAAGLSWLLEDFQARWGSQRHRQAVPWALCATVIAALLAINGPGNNMRNYRWAHDHARNMLACMLPNALVFPSGDHNTFPLIYLLSVEGLRPDVTVADKYGYIDLRLCSDMPDNPGKPRSPEEREAIERWLIENSRRPVYYTVKKPAPVDNARTIPVGVVYHLLPDLQECETNSCWEQIKYSNLSSPDAPMDHAAMNILSDYHYARGTRAIEQGRLDDARNAFAEATNLAWGIKEVFNNVGSALAEAGAIDDAIRYYEDAAKLDWRYAPARWNLARIFKSVQKFDWALRVYEDLTRCTPGDFRCFGEMGFLYSEHFDDRRRAEESWYESLKLNPRQEQIVMALAAGYAPSATPASAPATQPAASSQPSIAVPAIGKLEIKTPLLDLGTVVAGGEVRAECALANVGTGRLHISPAKPSCTCLQITPPAATVEPGTTTTMAVRYHSSGRIGPIDESITLESDDPQAPTATVRIRGVVIPILQAEPAELVIECYAGRTPDPVEFTLRHNGGAAFSVKAIGCDLADLSLEHGTEPASHHRVRGVWQAAPGGQRSAAIRIETTLADAPTITVPVKLDWPRPFRVRPSLVYLGRMARTTPATRTVQLEPAKAGMGFRPTIAEGPLPKGVTCDLRPSGELEWRLEIRVDPSQLGGGAFKTSIALKAEGLDQPIEVPVHGYVAE